MNTLHRQPKFQLGDRVVIQDVVRHVKSGCEYEAPFSGTICAMSYDPGNESSLGHPVYRYLVVLDISDVTVDTVELSIELLEDEDETG